MYLNVIEKLEIFWFKTSFKVSLKYLICIQIL
jgi:hypothetical protein